MPWTFNPFTGSFDQKGSGGGGASYIDGEVATYNDLPLDGTAALNSAWLVRAASGVWPVTRKQAGIYIRTATAGSSRDADYTYAGTMPDVFSDSVFLLYDEASTTRTGQFNLGSITAGQNRVLTWPDAAGTISLTGHTHAASDITSGTLDNARINFAAPSAIGGTTAAAITGTTGTFTTLAANNGALTASAPVLDLAQTWNNAAVTFRGVNWVFTDTSSGGSSEVFRISTGAAGTSAIFNIRKDGNATFVNGVNVGTIGGTASIAGQGGQWRVSDTGAFVFCTGAGGAYGTGDIFLRRDATGTLAQYNGSNAQTFNIYNTYSSSTNYERGFLRWSSNVFQIGTEKGSGGGTARALEFQTDGTTRLTISDIGNLTFQSAASFSWSGRTGLTATAAGSLRILGTDGSTFNFLYLGVNSSSYPALKRSSAILQVRLGDDSAYTTIDANHRLQGTAPATAGATGTAGDIRYDADYIYVCTATNTWKRAAIATW